ncbi:hypothetical protein ScalyP_jg4617 [Parmales sp. scaly parma]|nr:hypothetical protein ScalyP_jg4617 [Parmales sp. scaly parma]
MNNTIGLLNYRYFVLTLVFLDAVVLVGLLTVCRPFLDIYFHNNEVIEQVKNSMFSDEIPLATKCIVLLTPFLGGIYVLISSLLAWHIRLILRGLTTSEYKRGQQYPQNSTRLNLLEFWWCQSKIKTS